MSVLQLYLSLGIHIRQIEHPELLLLGSFDKYKALPPPFL